MVAQVEAVMGGTRAHTLEKVLGFTCVRSALITNSLFEGVRSVLDVTSIHIPAIYLVDEVHADMHIWVYTDLESYHFRLQVERYIF